MDQTENTSVLNQYNQMRHLACKSYALTVMIVELIQLLILTKFENDDI